MQKRNRLEWWNEAKGIEVIQIHSALNKEDKKSGIRKTQPSDVFNICVKAANMSGAAVQPVITVHCANTPMTNHICWRRRNHRWRQRRARWYKINCQEKQQCLR